MPNPFALLEHSRRVILIAAACLPLSIAHGQAATQNGNYRIMIDGVPAGAATIVANLPLQSSTAVRRADSTPPPRQAVSGEQASVIVTTSDSTLLSTLRDWIGANNAADKNTVKLKTVEIDQLVADGGPLRFVLHGAWPSRIEPGGASSVVSIVYQRAEMLR